jgi:hypothetical protein
MSLDIWVTATVTHDVVSKNITHNVNGMWREAGIYEDLYRSEGKTVSEILPNLEAGLALMKTEPERFKPHSASNGWGTYEQAVPWLEDFIEQIKEYPDGVIGISR